LTQRSLPMHGDLPESADRPRWALAAKGFRPFFLLAAAYAVVIVPVWILVLAGVLHPEGYLDATSWHAHEMLFGFAVAVLAGFLLTAVGNWTGRETAVGGPLLALAALWVLGRAAMIFPDALPHGLVAALDLAFLPALMIVIARPLVAARNRRNFVMVAILAALWAADVVVHLDALGVVSPGAARDACLVATDVIVFAILVVAGRVFPMFTRNATGVASIRSIPALEVLTVVAMAALVVLDVFSPGRASATVAGAVGVLCIARAAHWGARYTARHPLLWILHAGYAWLVLGLLARGVAAFDAALAPSLATHALTVGAIGSITLGMMARVALGHTGRKLVAPLPAAWAFAAILLAAMTRVFVPMIAPRHYLVELSVAAGLWAVAFALYLVSYVPVLLAPRVDGKPG
jgi:uncharacterized protein involved in response to NO